MRGKEQRGTVVKWGAREEGDDGASGSAIVSPQSETRVLVLRSVTYTNQIRPITIYRNKSSKFVVRSAATETLESKVDLNQKSATRGRGGRQNFNPTDC